MRHASVAVVEATVLWVLFVTTTTPFVPTTYGFVLTAPTPKALSTITTTSGGGDVRRNTGRRRIYHQFRQTSPLSLLVGSWDNDDFLEGLTQGPRHIPTELSSSVDGSSDDTEVSASHVSSSSSSGSAFASDEGNDNGTGTAADDANANANPSGGSRFQKMMEEAERRKETIGNLSPPQEDGQPPREGPLTFSSLYSQLVNSPKPQMSSQEQEAPAEPQLQSPLPPPVPVYPYPVQGSEQAQGLDPNAQSAAYPYPPPPYPYPPAPYPYPPPQSFYPPPPQGQDQATTGEGGVPVPPMSPYNPYLYFPPPPPPQPTNPNNADPNNAVNPYAAAYPPPPPGYPPYNPYYPYPPVPVPPPPGYGMNPAQPLPQQQQQQPLPPQPPSVPSEVVPQSRLQTQARPARPSPRPVGRNRDADQIANTADLYFAQLKMDSTIRTLAFIDGDYEKSNQAFTDERVIKLKDALTENPYLKAERLKAEEEARLLTTDEDEMLPPTMEEWLNADQRKAEALQKRKKVNYREQLRSAKEKK